MGVTYQDYYQILGVKRDASAEDIQRAYRKGARKYHPDVSKEPDAGEKFKKLNEAYEVLKDPETRQKYDTLGQNWKAGQDFNAPSGWDNVYQGAGGRAGPGAGPGAGGQGASFTFRSDGGSFSDFFEVLFGRDGGGPRPGGAGAVNMQDLFGGMGAQAGPGASGGPQFTQAPPTPQVHELAIGIGLEDAYHGATRSVEFQWDDPSGAGSGSGSGGGRKTKKLDVKIPAGTKDGTKIRLRGQGPSRNGVAGDLMLKVSIGAHPRYQVRDYDLITQLPVAPWEAALGAKVVLETLAGPVTVSIPAGSPSGRKLRLREKGMPKRDGGHGDLLAEIKIVVPTELSEKDKELFEQMKAESEFDPRAETKEP